MRKLVENLMDEKNPQNFDKKQFILFNLWSVLIFKFFGEIKLRKYTQEKRFLAELEGHFLLLSFSKKQLCSNQRIVKMNL